MSAQAKILASLRAHNRPLSDEELSIATGMPQPSVRRTRLHMVAAGAIVQEGNKWMVRAPWMKPDVYRGVQRL